MERPFLCGCMSSAAAKTLGNSGFIVGRKARNESPFLPGLILSERSSPSRVRCAAPQTGAPLTAPGRSEPRIRQEEKGF